MTTTNSATTKATHRGHPARKKLVFAAMAGAATLGAMSMAWACTFAMGDAFMSPTSVPRNTTFSFWGEGLSKKAFYKLYLVDNVQMLAGLDCHSTNTHFITKYKQYNASGAVVTKTGMKTDGLGKLDANFTMSGIQKYKAYLPSKYPAASELRGPHDFEPGIYPDPDMDVPTGRSTVCARQVAADGTLTDQTATEHLLFTVG